MKISTHNVISYLIISAVFITGNDLNLFDIPFYWYYPVYLVFIVFGFSYYQKINLRIISVLVVLVAFSFITYTNGVQLVIKQLVNIIFFTLAFYNLIAHENFNMEELFKKYIIFAKVILTLGFIQVLLFSIGSGELFLTIFPFLRETNITFRFQSITSEPSFISLTFAPIVFIAIYNLYYWKTYLINKRWSLLFILGYILTFALTAYMGMAIMLFFITFKRLTPLKKIRVSIVVLFTISVLSILAYSSSSLIRQRTDDTLYGLSNDFTKSSTYKKVNLSTYALLSNAYVAIKSLEENKWTGFGLGTHALAYDRFLPEDMQAYSTLNRPDGNSMAIRLLSETGLIGFSLFLFFLYHFRVRSKFNQSSQEDIIWIINTGTLVFLLICLLRNGNYTAHGKILFILCYYYSFRCYQNQTSKNNSITSGSNKLTTR